MVDMHQTGHQSELQYTVESTGFLIHLTPLSRPLGDVGHCDC